MSQQLRNQKGIKRSEKEENNGYSYKNVKNWSDDENHSWKQRKFFPSKQAYYR